MAVIVGAACQPLQPAGSGTGTPVPAAGSGTVPARTGQGKVQGVQAGGTATGRFGISPIPDAGAAPGAADGAVRVALLVPLSGRQQVLGEAVRDGFLAAHLESRAARRFDTLFLDEARLGAAEAQRQAVAAGARVLVGPLLKESLEALAPVAGPLPVLALNNLADGTRGPPELWQFGLSPEDEAREVADRAIGLGQRRAVVLIPASEWGQRLLAAFSDEYSALGGVVVDTATYLPGTPDYSVPIRRLLLTEMIRPPVAENEPNPGEKAGLIPGRRQDVDLLFVATNNSNGRQIVPQLKFFGAADLPTYSTSAIWEDGAQNAADLNGVMFPDGPWVVAPDARATMIKNGLVRYWGRGALDVSRLYALGYDAYQLLPGILRQPMPGPFNTGELDGVTGRLSADSTGRIHRRLTWVEIRGGQPLPLAGTTDAPGTR